MRSIGLILRVRMKLLLSVAFLSGALAAHGGEARKVLLDLDRESTSHVEDGRVGRLSPERLEDWKAGFRAKLEAEVAREPLTPDEAVLHSRIISRIGDGKGAVAALDRALDSDARNPMLLSAKGKLLYEQKNFTGAAESSLQAWEASGRTDNDAWAVYMLSKGRGKPASSSATQTSAPASGDAPVPDAGGHPATAPAPKKTASTSAAPGLVGIPDPAWTQTAGAREMLQKSRLGNEVLSYALGEGVKFELVDLPSYVGARFDKDRKVIQMPKSAASGDPVEMAVSLGHEAYHARQTLRDGMTASIETEQDANFADRVIYHEMLQAGARPLPSKSIIGSNYEVWKLQARKLDLPAFQDDIEEMYGSKREQVLIDSTASLPRFLQGPLRKALIAVDADGLKDYETLDYQKGKWWNVAERTAIESTRQQHIKDQAWQQKWMKEHQAEF